MKSKRSIIITNSKLRRIRNNLRVLIHLAESAEMQNLLDQQLNIQNSSHFWDKKHPQYKELRKEVEYLASKANELSYAFNASIIYCPTCMKIDRDMTYNPFMEKWYCVDCYEENKKFHTKQGHPERFP